MPLDYGSGFEPPKLLTSEIAIVPTEKAGSSFISLLRVLVTIAEVGLSLLIPGAIAGTSIALVGAAASTALSAASGEINPISEAINFGAALVPGLSTGIRGLRTAEELTVEEIQALSEAAESSSDVRVVNRIKNRVTAETAKVRKSEISQIKQLASKTENTKLYSKLIGTSEEDIRKIILRSGFSNEDIVELDDLLVGTTKQSERNSIITGYLQKLGGNERTIKFIKSLNEIHANETIKNIVVKESTNPEASKGFFARYVKALKHPAGADFNDYVVQPVQAIFDAKDLGRAPIEAAYKYLSRAIKKETDKLVKYLGKAEKVEEAFEKAGGIVVNSNVILGYKIIEEVPGKTLVQISFHPETSGAKHAMWNGRATKNFGGKKPVYVQANAESLARLTAEGMRYYQKKWALSKGGAPVGTAAFGLVGLTSEAEMLLPFINTGLMRNILSLTSNIVDNTSESIAGTGGWTNGWVDRFKESFNKNYKNRIGRLVGRKIGGGVATVIFGHKIGALFGRELQRVASTFASSLNAAEYGKRGTFSQRFGKAFKSQIASRIAASAQGNLRRRARAMPGSHGSVVLGSLSSTRKLSFVRRIPGAALPGQSPLNKLGIKLP